MHKILQNHLLCAFVANLKIDAIYALYLESFCGKNLAIRKVFAISDSALLLLYTRSSDAWSASCGAEGTWYTPVKRCTIQKKMVPFWSPFQHIFLKLIQAYHKVLSVLGKNDSSGYRVCTTDTLMLYCQAKNLSWKWWIVDDVVVHRGIMFGLIMITDHQVKEALFYTVNRRKSDSVVNPIWYLVHNCDSFRYHQKALCQKRGGGSLFYKKIQSKISDEVPNGFL